MTVDFVSDLYFGRDDAEHDMADGLLRDGFLPTAAYRSVRSGRKLLVVGRKGVGKSAICVQLAHGQERLADTVLVTPDDAAGDEIRRFELQGLTPETAKSLIWRYVFAVHLARHIVARSGHHPPKSVRALRGFLQANGEDGEAGLYDRLASGVRGLQTSLSLEAFGIKASADFGGGSSEGARATTRLATVEAGIGATLREPRWAQRGGPLTILVDQLEQIWSNDPESRAMVTGLLLAGKHMTRQYAAALRCVLFLRADIYDGLDFTDGDKFRGDEIRIEWAGDQLKQLALTRAAVSLRRPTLTADQLWGEVFPAQVGESPIADYLLARSLPRPRDAIQFLNLCRDKAAERSHRRIEESDVLAATVQFSEWKLQDLAREYVVNFPFLSRVFALFHNTGYVVIKHTFQARLDAHRDALQARFPDYVEALTVDGVVDVLFAVNFLGVLRGSEVVYAGGTHVPIQPDETEFHIHPCFRPALNATSRTGLRPYTPLVPRRWIGGHSLAVRGAFVGAESGGGRGQDFRLAEALIDACGRIRRQLGRANLPPDTAYAISVQVGRVATDADNLVAHLRDGQQHDVVSHILAAVNYLNSLADELADSVGAGSGQLGYVVGRIQDEARVLRRAAGGSYSGGSSS